jgi:hypothetical protein
VNPMAGWPDDGTAFIKPGHNSLGETAYDVVMDNESDMEEIAKDLYKDEEGGVNKWI